jgi:hypothetical protein
MGIMQTESIFSTLLAAAAFLKHAVQGVASQAVRDAYGAAKTYLRKKFAANPDAARALELATEKPESLIRKALLVEDSALSALDRDSELARCLVTTGCPHGEDVPGWWWMNNKPTATPHGQHAR